MFTSSSVHWYHLISGFNYLCSTQTISCCQGGYENPHLQAELNSTTLVQLPQYLSLCLFEHFALAVEPCPRTAVGKISLKQLRKRNPGKQWVLTFSFCSTSSLGFLFCCNLFTAVAEWPIDVGQLLALLFAGEKGTFTSRILRSFY